MNTEKDNFISIIQCNLNDSYYSINTYHDGDIYVSSVFPELKINLKDIF